MMQKKLRFFILLLALVLVLGGAYAGYRKLSEQYSVQTPSASVEPAQDFLDFTVFDADGAEVQLSSLLGKPLLINYWATWCPFCIHEFPDLQDAFERYGEDVQFVMVNFTDGVRETVETASAYIDENGYTFPVYFDKEGSAAAAYGVTGFPTTLFLAADGRLVHRQSGILSIETIEEQMQRLLEAQ